MMTRHDIPVPLTHGPRLGALGFAILLGSMAIAWVGQRFVGADLATEGLRFVDGLALLTALAAASAVWTLAGRLARGVANDD